MVVDVVSPQSTEGVSNLVNYIAWRSSEATMGLRRQIRIRRRYQQFLQQNIRHRLAQRAFVGPDAKYADYSDITNLTAEQFAILPAYANLKFHPADGETATHTIGNVTDIPMMRVEEMYLIEAEATARHQRLRRSRTAQNLYGQAIRASARPAASSADVVERSSGTSASSCNMGRRRYIPRHQAPELQPEDRIRRHERAFGLPLLDRRPRRGGTSVFRDGDSAEHCARVAEQPNPVGIIKPWVQ